jgi:cytochrome c553
MSNPKDAVRKVLDAVKADKRASLTAPEGKLVCDAYGIPVPKEGVAKSAAEAAKLAADMGFPVVMKIVSPDILHKTEAGGVIVGLKSAEDAEKAYETILGNARKYKSDAKIEGVQVQQMLAGGTEVIVGSITDASFGKLVAFGLGGVLVEVLKDITFRLAPATKQDALSMLDGIQAHEILKGVRGGEPVNGVAACAACHGPAGAGNPTAKYPSIRGQHAAYVVAQLKAYRSGTRKTDQPQNQMMRNIAAKLSDVQIDALAAYVRGLR